MLRTPGATNASLTSLLPAAWSAVVGGDPAPLPLPAHVRGVVVLVVDGLGRRLLDEHRAVAPLLAAADGPTLDATFPATTATNLTSLGTGVAAGRHGVVGTAIALPGEARPLVALSWTWERQIGGADAREDLPPERVQAVPTLLERATDDGVRVVTVLDPAFAASGLTRAGLRGGRVRTAVGLEATLATAVTAAAHGPALVYAHHGDVDLVGHLYGPGSAPWCAELAHVETVLTALRPRLPADVAVIVTADHGMVGVPAHTLVDLADRPELTRDVRVLAGDPRARQLHVVPGTRGEVLARWRDAVGHTGVVTTREEALAAGWFGPPDHLDGGVVPRIGDVLVCATGPGAWVHRDLDPHGGRLAGQHAAPTDAELAVPATVLTR